MASLDALLGRILNHGDELELQGGLDFKSPLSATPNPSEKTIDIEVDLSDLESAVAALQAVAVLTHTATPEGAVTAAVGRLCVDTTSGTLYIKTSGSGNTGWTVVGTQT